MKRSFRGFSLVELLVVILIVGLGISFAALTISDNKAYQLRLEAKHLVNNLELVLDESILSNHVWGLDFYQSINSEGQAIYGYRWLSKQEDAWQESKLSGGQTHYSLPANIDLTLEIEGALKAINAPEKSSDNKQGSPGSDIQSSDIDSSDIQGPDIWLASSGEITPFRLVLADRENQEIQLVIEADQLARINLDGEGDVVYP